MSFELEIIQRIKSEEVLIDRLKTIKLSASTIGAERQALLDMEMKKEYVKGLKDALSIIQKKR